MTQKKKSSEMDQDSCDSATVVDASDETLSSDGPARPCRRIEIDKKGDLCLWASPQASFCLSSKILSMASGYFEELFNNDKTAWPVAGPIGMPLRVDQDDLEALSLLFHLLHYRLELYEAEHKDQDQDPWTPDIHLLFKFAKLSDKYRCSAAVRLQGIRWLRLLQYEDGEYDDEEVYKDVFVKHAQVAHLLDDPEGLQTVYGSLAWYYDTETGDDIAKRTSFPERFKGEFYARRSQIFRELLRRIEEAVTGLRPYSKGGCLCTQVRFDGVLPLLESWSLFPLSDLWDRKFSDVIDSFEKKFDDWDENHHHSRCTAGEGCALHQTLQRLRKSFRDIEAFASEGGTA